MSNCILLKYFVVQLHIVDGDWGRGHYCIAISTTNTIMDGITMLRNEAREIHRSTIFCREGEWSEKEGD